MREILFRGQLRRKGEKVNMAGEPLPSIWKYGGVSQYGGGAMIYQAEPKIEKFPVYGDTVGQYTGLRDKNGKKIFEGDVVDVLYNPRYGGVAKQRIGIRKVVFEDGCFMMEDDEGYHLHFIVNEDITVVGNIYDNPELLEGED